MIVRKFSSRYTSGLVVSLSALIGGCAAPLPDVNPGREAAEAIDLSSSRAIEYQIDAGALDLPTLEATELSIADAIRFAVETDPGIQSALSRVRVALAEAKQSRLLPNPILSVVFRFPEGGGDPTIEAGIAAELLGLLTRPGQTRAADHRLRGVAAEAITSVLDVAANVRETYVNIQAAEASIVVLESRRDLLRRLLELTQARLRLGEGTRLDLLTLQTQVVDLETEIADRELERREQRLQLARLIGRPSAEPAWQVSTWDGTPSIGGTEADWIRTALERRPEAQSRQWQLQALGVERALARWALLEGAEAGIESERDGDWSVGPALSIPIPLFDMGQARRERTTAALSEARHELVATRRLIIEEVRRALASFQASSVNRKRVRDELIPLQQARLDQAEAQYKAGQTDITALIIAEQEFQSARARLVELEQRSALALVKLERAVGGAGAAKQVNPDPGTQPVTQPAE